MLDLNLLTARLAEHGITLRSLAEQAGAVFHPSGRNLVSTCPLHHGDNPRAFHLYRQGSRWHCFTRCPQAENDGDLIGFYMRWKKFEFPQALRELVSLAGLGGQVDLYPRSIAPASIAIPASFLHALDQNRLAAVPIFTSSLLNPPSLPASLASLSSRPASPAWQHRACAFLEYAQRQLNHPRRGERVREYLARERGLTPETQAAFQLGYNPGPVLDDRSAWGIELAESSNQKVFLPWGIVIPGFVKGQLCHLKIRRPTPSDSLAAYLAPSQGASPAFPHPRPSPKYLSVLGSRPLLFGCDHFNKHPVLLLTEGEFDCLLAWQFGQELAREGVPFDTATLGSASNRVDFHSRPALLTHEHILAVYDDDPAGDQARQALSSVPRVQVIPPPDHDLTDYWRKGGDLRAWLRNIARQFIETS
jgi:hypothetical protein